MGQAQENRRRNVPHGKAEIMIFCGTMTAAVRSALNIMWNMKTHGNDCFAMSQNIKKKYEKIFRRRLYASYQTVKKSQQKLAFFDTIKTEVRIC